MDFFEYACNEAFKFFIEYHYPGIKSAGKVPGGYVFRADLGPKWDDALLFPDPYVFVLEEDKTACQIDIGSKKNHYLMDNMIPVEVPDKYLSPRILARKDS